MIEPSAFFVYGTLKKKQLRGGMWPRQPVSVVPGVVRARLFDIGPYPAALHCQAAPHYSQATLHSPTTQHSPVTRKEEAWLLGEIWQFQHVDLAETKKVLDQIEGYYPGASDNEYVRDVVEAQCVLDNDRALTKSCWMYFSPNQDLLVGKREIVPFCTLSQVFSTVREDWSNEKVAFWPDPLARVPRSFSEE
ncbi:MAG: gamma-glutamylcyclotransferase [Pirellula sp.]|jgi:gamma-glutamylcyclotransferase (GGCT)/AIG2-like uncharacterized protein YtfP|nr:gamma-glutamylcyclotransferase [Pirellula sp.]